MPWTQKGWFLRSCSGIFLCWQPQGVDWLRVTFVDTWRVPRGIWGCRLLDLLRWMVLGTKMAIAPLLVDQIEGFRCLKSSAARDLSAGAFGCRVARVACPQGWLEVGQLFGVVNMGGSRYRISRVMFFGSGVSDWMISSMGFIVHFFCVKPENLTVWRLSSGWRLEPWRKRDIIMLWLSCCMKNMPTGVFERLSLSVMILHAGNEAESPVRKSNRYVALSLVT